MVCHSAAGLCESWAYLFYSLEPFVKLLMGGDMALVPIRFNANVRAAGTRGEIHVAALGPQPSDIIGASLWYGPGKAQFFT